MVELQRNSKIAILVLVVTGIGLIGFSSINAIDEIKNDEKFIIESKINVIDLISSQYELRMNYIVNIVELASKRPEIIKGATFPDSISEELRGIPQNMEPEMRQIAKDMLEQNFFFSYFFYVVSDGDMYFLEPFEEQLDLKWLNYSFRDWYKGATSTGVTYLSEVYVSAANYLNVIAIAVPMFDEDEEFIGIFAGTVDLYPIEESFQQLQLGDGEYLIIVDQNNRIVEDSRNLEAVDKLSEFSLDLRDESTNEIQHIIKEIDDIEMIVVFKSTPIGTQNWIIMTLQPNNLAFATSTDTFNELIHKSAILVGILAIAGTLIVRKINTNAILTKELTNKNVDLKKQKEVISEQILEIKEVEKEKEDFTAMITHDLKQPLVPIQGNIDLLKMPEMGELNEMQKESIDEIHSHTILLLSMIDNIISAQKLGAKSMEYKIEELSSKTILSECIKTHSPIMKDKNIEYFDSSTIDIKIKADQRRILESFTNLIQNSHDFVPENGKIEIGVTDGEKEVTFFVKDNGEGIPKEKQKKLFKKYGQIESTAKRKYGGTGLGLAVCQQLVEGMKGKIWLESEAGKGSTFFFTIPKAE